jgi:hypothetical protein
MGISLPPFSDLRVNYPLISSDAVISSIGGGVGTYLLNTCVLRMSKAFNYLGDQSGNFDSWPPTPPWKVKPTTIGLEDPRKKKAAYEKLHSIPATYKYVKAFETTYGADKKRYCYRVNEFFDYINHKYKNPDFTIKLLHRNTMLTVDQINGLKNNIYGKTGIICFRTKFGADAPGTAASGHFTLWDGAQCLHDEFFQDVRTSSIHFWTC